MTEESPRAPGPDADRPLTEAEIDLAFRLLLNRPPKPATRTQLLRTGVTLAKLRERLFDSAEFHAIMSRRQSRAAAIDAAADSGPTLVHIHVPKTAGTSLNALLLPLVPRHSRLHGRGPECVAALRGMSMDERARVRLVVGHVTHSIGRLLPQPVRFLTILRDPGPRILSYYKYVRHQTSHPLYDTVKGRDMSFGAFLEMAAETPSLRSEMEAGQMRRIAGDMSQKGFGREAALFDAACRHLLAPGFLFGFTEAFDAFQARLVAEGILPAAQPMEKNVSPPGLAYAEARAALSEAQAELLDRFIHWDDRFLAFARSAETPNRAA